MQRQQYFLMLWLYSIVVVSFMLKSSSAKPRTSDEDECEHIHRKSINKRCGGGGGGEGDSDDDGGCFPPDAIVQTPNRNVTMENLEIGTDVLVLNEEGELVYSPVIAFLDRNNKLELKYVPIETENGTILTLTRSHLIHKANQGGTNHIQPQLEKPENVLPTFASKLKMNDYIFIISEHHNEFKAIPSKVVSITNKKIKGAYAPLTLEGTIVVNGAIASCYAVIDDQRMAHMALAPLRLLYHSMPSLLREKQGDVLLSWYPSMLETVGRMILDEKHFYSSSVKDLIRGED